MFYAPPMLLFEDIRLHSFKGLLATERPEE
jgi:hypothetical protein